MGAAPTLDLSLNTALTTLDCSSNQLNSLDVSQNTALTYLDCNYNQLTILTLTHNPALTYLDCGTNYLNTLDVRNANNTNFTYFNAINNSYLSCISVDDALWSNTNWTNIDASSSFALTCSSLTSYTYVPDNNFEQALIDLGYDNFLDNYVLTANINTVSSLDVASNSIVSLTGIEDFTALTTLDCGDNLLYYLNVNSNTALTYLDCGGNQLTILNVSQNTDKIIFQVLDCTHYHQFLLVQYLCK